MDESEIIEKAAQESEIIEKAAQDAGITHKQAEQVIKTTEDARTKEALKSAREALEPPDDAGRTGLVAWPSIKHLRGRI